jgi:predicted HicB family RNase H-like nuclease
MDGALMGRPKKFRKPRNISITVESADHEALRVEAAKKGQSLSDFIRSLTLKVIRNK